MVRVSPLKPLSLILRLTIILAVLAAIPALIYSNLSLAFEENTARERYSRTQKHLGNANDQLKAVETRLVGLTTTVEAVERAGRGEFKMIRPGETLVLLRFEGGNGELGIGNGGE